MFLYCRSASCKLTSILFSNSDFSSINGSRKGVRKKNWKMNIVKIVDKVDKEVKFLTRER